MSIKSSREFYSLVREEFAYLEADSGPSPDFTIMDIFYESIYRGSYPFLRECGYWNVFLRLDLQWDYYDNLFMLTLVRRTGPSGSETSSYVHMGEILSAMDPRWPANWRTFDPNDGPAQVKVYARAIKPLAREIFIPQDREAQEFEGFAWYKRVADMRNERKSDG